MALYTRKTIILLLTFITTPFLSSTSFCASIPDNFEKSLQNNASLNTQIEKVLPEKHIEKIEKIEKEEVSIFWDIVLPIAGISCTVIQGARLGGQAGGAIGRTVGGTPNREAMGLRIGIIAGGALVVGAMAKKGIGKTAGTVLSITELVEKLEEGIVAWQKRNARLAGEELITRFRAAQRAAAQRAAWEAAQEGGPQVVLEGG